jgi:hypothetical protein
MSNDLYITCRSKPLASAMSVFIKENYRPWSVIARHSPNEEGPADFMSMPERESNRPLTLGIWYSACEPQRDYAWTLARWIAIRAGRKLYFPSLGESFVYFSYNRCDAFPHIPKGFVFPDETREKWAWTQKYDDLGCRDADDELDIRRRETMPEWQAEIDKGYAIIRAEIVRLDELWMSQRLTRPWVV